MKRSSLEVFVGWPLLLLGQGWFVAQGFTQPSVMQWVTEAGCLMVLGAAQARLAPEGPWRSPWMPAVFALGVTSLAIGPSGSAGAVYWLGIGCLCIAGLVRLERVRRWGLWAGVLAGLLGAVGSRGLVLARAAGGGGEGRQTSVARSPMDQLRQELMQPSFSMGLTSASDGPPVLLITVDTLRWDAARDMKSVQRIAAHGALWERAMSTSSWTVPAMGTILTGQMPVGHGAGVNAEGRLQGLEPDVKTLAERFSDAGYATGAVATNAWLTSGLGFDAGFDRFWHPDANFHHRLSVGGFPEGPMGHEAEAVIDRAVAMVQTAPDRGVFVWVHLIDPHLPFLHAPEGSLESELTDERLRSGLRLTTDLKDRVKAAYAHEVAYTDAHIERLLDAVEARGWLESGVVVLTADHGEEFWDHGGTGHGHAHHGEVVDVGLVMGGALRTERRTDRASLLDVASTVAAITGLNTDGLEGQDLRRPMHEDRITTAVGNAYFLQQQSARSDDYRAIVTVETDEMRCTALGSDPTERDAMNCVDVPEPVVAAAKGVKPPGARGETLNLESAALEALGYLDDAE